MKTYLYVKTHSITGLKYFGKTTKNPFKYPGSGIHWRRHLKKHGNEHTTEVIAEFDDPDECEKFALEFSHKNNIVESIEWANLIPENGKDGMPVGHAGHVFTDDEKSKIAEALRRNWEDPVYRATQTENRRRAWTDERRAEQSERLSGKSRPEHSSAMKGRKLNPDHPFIVGEKTDSHKKAISASLKGKPKSPEHVAKLKQPKPRVCRLEDRKEMSVNHFTRWLLRVQPTE